MTRKRFAIEIDDENIAHILDNGADIGQYNLCKLLNKLAEEKEYYQIKSGKCEEELLNLRRDNKQLKQRIKELEVENEAQSDAIDGLQEFMAHHNLEV